MLYKKLAPVLGLLLLAGQCHAADTLRTLPAYAPVTCFELEYRVVTGSDMSLVPANAYLTDTHDKLVEVLSLDASVYVCMGYNGSTFTQAYVSAIPAKNYVPFQQTAPWTIVAGFMPYINDFLMQYLVMHYNG